MLQHLPAENPNWRPNHVQPGIPGVGGVHVLLSGQPHFRREEMVRIETWARVQLVVAEIVVALVSLICAGLMINTGCCACDDVTWWPRSGLLLASIH
jgi:hypothetical protein